MNYILDALKKIRTPIVSDALESFHVRPRNVGTMDASIRCILPSLGAMVGYACTAKVVGASPPVEGESVIAWRDVWEYVGDSPRPSVVVVQDLDKPPGRSCAWGDIAASIMLNLGCVGAVTNGGVRDIREVEELGFHLFAPSPVVAHAYIRYVELDTPVEVGSLIVRPGDLLHADEHGVLMIPREIPLNELLKVIPKFLASEGDVIKYCTQSGFNLEELCHRMTAHEARVGSHFSMLSDQTRQ